MNIRFIHRFFHATSLILAAGMVILASGMSGTVSAAINTTKDSATFNTLSWEGDVLPPKIYGPDIDDWSVDGNGNYEIVQDGVPGMAGSNGAFSAATGWTVEWRMKMDLNNLPTANNIINTMLPSGSTGGRAALNTHLADDTTGAVAGARHFQNIAVGHDGVGGYTVFDVNSDTLLYRGANELSEYITVRLAVEASGGDDEIKVYVNGLEAAAEPPGAVNDSYNRQWFGDEGAVVSSGTAIVDYFRYDTTGAFAPIAPTPTPELDRGHRVLLERGLQLEAMAFINVTGGFDTTRWAESNFTTPNLQYNEYNPVHLPTPGPGIPWSRWMHPENLDDLGANPGLAALGTGEYPYLPNLVRLQLKDEPTITDPTELATQKAAVASLRAKYPDVLLYTSDGSTAYTSAEWATYMAEVEPDMLNFAEYPYNGSVAGGSPTILYAGLEKFRVLGLAGNDGTGNNPIPVGRYIQTFTRAPVQNNHIVSESEIRLDQFAGWAFGNKLAAAFVYDDPDGAAGLTAVMFTGSGTGSPTVQFDQIAETNRQSLNLGPALLRLISADARMIMGQQDPGGGAVPNLLPAGVSTWDASADPFITSISATNLGSLNNSLRGDVIVGYFNPLDPQYTDPGTADDDDLYFMIVNGLSDATGSASAAQQEITINFDFTSDPTITSLQRLSRDTGLVEDVMLTSTGVNTYQYVWTLDGGTGDLFKFDTGSSFVGIVADADADFDMDGDVDGFDFLTFQRGLGIGATLAEGDANGDNVVDELDLAIWESQYGTTSPLSAASAAVPEPTSALLLLLGCCATCLFNPPRALRKAIS